LPISRLQGAGGLVHGPPAGAFAVAPADLARAGRRGWILLGER
jgi:hypothetical protein